MAENSGNVDFWQALGHGRYQKNMVVFELMDTRVSVDEILIPAKLQSIVSCYIDREIGEAVIDDTFARGRRLVYDSRYSGKVHSVRMDTSKRELR